MLEHYLDLKWPVLPLLPGDIRPPFPWREFKERPPGEKEWALWREIFPVPPHGIALLTGQVSGIVVVDIDDTKVAERFTVEIPFLTPCVRTRRGFHFFFRTNGEIPTTKVRVPGIGELEIKADGSLVPLPPTRHRKDPSFKYEWLISPWEVPKIPPLPDFVLEAIERQKREKELARAVGRVSFPRPGHKLTPEALREILAAVDAMVVKEVPTGGGLAWRLRECPLCKKSEGNPWIWLNSGRLFDFRVTCPASRDRGGLPLRAWLRELGREDLLENLEAEEHEETPPPDVPVASVEEARRLILEALRSDRNVFLVVPPGTGKSTLALEWACQEASQPVVFSTPTLELARELAERARKVTNEPVIALSGRNPDTCLAWPETEKARKLGYDPGQVICPWCQYNPDIPTLSAKCLFYKQFENLKRERGIYFGSHILIAHLLKNELKKKQSLDTR